MQLYSLITIYFQFKILKILTLVVQLLKIVPRQKLRKNFFVLTSNFEL